MNAPQSLTPANAPIGALLAGGILLGRFFLEVQPYVLIGAPKAEGDFPRTVWNKSLERVAGALSDFDGLANTRAMAEAGSALATKILALRLSDHDDWYLPSRGELLLAWSARAALPEAERFDKDWYWSSTQYADDSDYAWNQGFLNGIQNYWLKDLKTMARAVRRVSI
jgi:hypothetical protein